ncbi:MAG TPA: phosphotransferase [Candidatus Limnocylindrales bacterium]|nr:phosphotransferase [Candidatus Limnocylindrales bacterium]
MSDATQAEGDHSAASGTTDRRLAARVVQDWVPDATLTPLDAMNSSTWEVGGGPERYVLKIADPGNQPGLHVASCLEGRGIQTGAPVRMAHVEGRLVALLRYVDGRPLVASDAEAIGQTLGRIHRALSRCEPPAVIDRWPWPWLDPTAITDAELRWASVAAIERADSLAPSLTHGLLHGDPAPEAFLATRTGVALIDWGSCCHGPLLFDVASAVMYAGHRVIDGYADAGPLASDELAQLEVLIRFRWALQAWYFSVRLASDDLTGIDDEAGNRKGLADARAGLGLSRVERRSS